MDTTFYLVFDSPKENEMNLRTDLTDVNLCLSGETEPARQRPFVLTHAVCTDSSHHLSLVPKGLPDSFSNSSNSTIFVFNAKCFCFQCPTHNSLTNSLSLTLFIEKTYFYVVVYVYCPNVRTPNGKREEVHWCRNMKDIQ